MGFVSFSSVLFVNILPNAFRDSLNGHYFFSRFREIKEKNNKSNLLEKVFRGIDLIQLVTMAATFEEELNFENEEFPFPKTITRETFLNDLQIDPTNPAQSIVRINEVKFNVDQFLFDHYRFTSLEDLQAELFSLLKELDQELFNLVNNDYFDFINLGKSLEGGESLVDRLRVDVSKYRKKLKDENSRLDESKKHVEASVENIKKLKQLKVS